MEDIGRISDLEQIVVATNARERHQRRLLELLGPLLVDAVVVDGDALDDEPRGRADRGAEVRGLRGPRQDRMDLDLVAEPLEQGVNGQLPVRGEMVVIVPDAERAPELGPVLQRIRGVPAFEEVADPLRFRPSRLVQVRVGAVVWEGEPLRAALVLIEQGHGPIMTPDRERRERREHRPEHRLGRAVLPAL